MSICYAFVIGGLLCAAAQVLIDRTNLTPARILVLYTVAGVFLGAVGLYRPLFDLAGCGVSVPILGFGGTVATGVSEAVNGAENGISALLGVFISPLSAAAGGIGASLIFAFVISLLFRSKPKRMTSRRNS